MANYDSKETGFWNQVRVRNADFTGISINEWVDLHFESAVFGSATMTEEQYILITNRNDVFYYHTTGGENIQIQN